VTDDPNEKKTGDLTSLSDLPTGASETSFAPSLENDAPPALEGLDDLLSPMSPTSTGVGSGEPASSSFTFSPSADVSPESDLSEAALLDPIASLPPVDGDILAAAAGTDSPPSLAPEESESSEIAPDVALAPPESLLEAELDATKPEATAIGAAIANALSTSPAMDAVRDYSDRVAPVASPAVADTPYSLVIEGPLRPHERETLLSILSRENLGIREVELEPQFAAGHILVPRISEYAGVLIVQALRNTTAKMRLGPSERIFVSREAEDATDRLIVPPSPESETFIHEEGSERAETVVLTSSDTVPGRKLLAAIDTLHNSMNLKSISLTQPQSPIFQDAIERLKKQLKFQAHHRGANALVGFKYALHPLEGQSTYKLVVEARAVRVADVAPPAVDA
jgi:hypothetical protein